MTQAIITAASAVTALGALAAIPAALFRWKNQREQNDDRFEKSIKELKSESSLLCVGLLACLDGLEQLGANHSVPAARRRLERYLNEQAHKA
jgi:hypothetical protein